MAPLILTGLDTFDIISLIRYLKKINGLIDRFCIAWGSCRNKEKLTDSACKQICSILQWQTTTWIHYVYLLVSGLVQLRVVGDAAASQQNSSPMRAGSHSPSSNRAAIGSWWSTAHCLDPGCVVLPVPHPAVDKGLGGGHVHYHHLVLPVTLVLGWDFWYQHDVHRLPRAKPVGVIVGWWKQLLEDVARNVNGSLQKYNCIKISVI